MAEAGRDPLWVGASAHPSIRTAHIGSAQCYPPYRASISPLWPGTRGGGGGSKPVTGSEDVKKSGVLTTCPHRSEEAGRVELPLLPLVPRSGAGLRLSEQVHAHLLPAHTQQRSSVLSPSLDPIVGVHACIQAEVTSCLPSIKSQKVPGRWA